MNRKATRDVESVMSPTENVCKILNLPSSNFAHRRLENTEDAICCRLVRKYIVTLLLALMVFYIYYILIMWPVKDATSHIHPKLQVYQTHHKFVPNDHRHADHDHHLSIDRFHDVIGLGHDWSSGMRDSSSKEEKKGDKKDEKATDSHGGAEIFEENTPKVEVNTEETRKFADKFVEDIKKHVISEEVTTVSYQDVTLKPTEKIRTLKIQVPKMIHSVKEFEQLIGDFDKTTTEMKEVGEQVKEVNREENQQQNQGENLHENRENNAHENGEENFHENQDPHENFEENGEENQENDHEDNQNENQEEGHHEDVNGNLKVSEKEFPDHLEPILPIPFTEVDHLTTTESLRMILLPPQDHVRTTTSSMLDPTRDL